MHGWAINVVVEEVLAPCAGALQDPAVDNGGRPGESALRARHRHRRTGETALMQPGQPVQGVPFGHGQPAVGVSGPGTGGG